MQVVYIFENIAFHGPRNGNIIHQASAIVKHVNVTASVNCERATALTSNESHIHRAQRHPHVDRPAPQT
jgi:hypothetical protein